MPAKKRTADSQPEIRNPKANYNYFVGDRFECGIVLQGTEVKSIRNRDVRISEAFCRVEKRQIWLYNAHIGEYAFGNSRNHSPRRKRKLILHRREINKLIGAIETGGKSLIPIRMYLKHGLIKVEIALCTGKKLYDKREALKKRITLREAEREMRRRY